MAPILHLMAQLAMMTPTDMAARVQAFSGLPAIVDQRLILPECPALAFAWASAQSVVVSCGAPEWRVYVPIVAPTAALAPTPTASAPTIRRGDRVVIEAGGEGFYVGMDTVAESDSRDGRVTLRAPGSNRRLVGSIDADGHVRINGLNAMVSGR